MAFNQRWSEEGNTGSQPNTSSADEFAAISDLEREAGEMMVIRTLKRYARTILTPLIHQIVKEQIVLAKQELLATMNHTNNTSSSVPKLKLQFRNKISLPVFSGKPLLSENQTPIEMALVDSFTEQIVNTGIASTSKVEIFGFRVVGDNDYSWKVKELQERTMSERNGKRTLQGNTCVELKDGVGFTSSNIHFTHNSKHTRNGMYRLGAKVVDADLNKVVQVAWTEAFFLQDHRSTYSKKHPFPFLSDKVSHLKQISRTRSKHMKDEGVITVKDLLTLVYTDQKRLEKILDVAAGTKIWNEIVENAQASNGMFLYLDPSKERKTGVVLNVKLQLTGLIVEPHQYVSVNHLSNKQKIDSQNLVKFASENLEMTDSFEDEASLKEYLQLVSNFIPFPRANQSLGSGKIMDEPTLTTPYSEVTNLSSDLTQVTNSMNTSYFNMGPSTKDTSTVTSQFERGKEKALFDDKTVYSKHHYKEYISSHPPNQEVLNKLTNGTATAYNITDAGTSSKAVDILSRSLEESEDLKASIVTTSERGKKKVTFDDERVHSKNYYQEYISSHPPNPEGLKKLDSLITTAHNATKPGSSSQDVESLLDTLGIDKHDIFNQSIEEWEDFQHLMNTDFNIHEYLNNEWESDPANSDAGVVTVAEKSVSVAIAGTRWRRVFELLRGNFVRKRISRSQGIQSHKKQRCC
ncbi:CALMODULIN-BINDING PROTEIN60 [Artemisia annua]|uniref:CALMODULIN-BINDING PROTEIN60 n=1 Tax=Artemisia annua TaxID=35608 RepID=A0A2U1KIQ1_ARTAN|nr:CALMODULIN-BINDING PROTEIN60 [Artemisia annua]